MQLSVAKLQRLLPDPDKLELLADWLDVKYPDDNDSQVQLDLRRWARGIRDVLQAAAADLLWERDEHER